jgi:putative Mn2+ efflux pump MntP
MKNKTTQMFKVIAVMFIISIIYSLTAMYPDYGSSFDMGYSAGSAFGKMTRVLGAIGLIAYGIRTIKRRALNTLE